MFKTRKENGYILWIFYEFLLFEKTDLVLIILQYFYGKAKQKLIKKTIFCRAASLLSDYCFSWRSHLLVTGKILSRRCLLRLVLHLCYICSVIVFSLRVQNSESFCWLSWSMQSWHATGQADLPSLRWGNNRASLPH